MLEYIRSLIFKCEFVGADALVPNELRIYYALFYVYLVKAFVMEVSMSINVYQWILYICLCVYWCRQTTQRHLDKVCWLQMTLM